jgi:biotin carboxylase
VPDQRLLVLGAGPAQLGALDAARRRGLTVVAADRDPAAPGFRLADRRAIVSIEDEPAIERLARAEDVDGILAPGADHAVASAARIAQRMALPHPLSPDAALLAASRRRQRERLAAAGVPQPRAVVCRGLPDVLAAAEELGWPCLIEAPDREGERTVIRAANREEAVGAAAEAFTESVDDYCLVEEIVAGPAVTVAGFALSGRLFLVAAFDRDLAPAPAFAVPLVLAWPPVEPLDGVGELVQQGLAALGVEDGPVVALVLLTAAGPQLAKLSARTGGSHESELSRAALGIDLDALAVAVALGEAVEPDALEPKARAGGACAVFLVAPPGELEETHGLAAACAVPGVVSARAYRSPGHRFGELRRASERAGAVLATGATRGEAEQAARSAAALVELVTRSSGAAA